MKIKNSLKMKKIKKIKEVNAMIIALYEVISEKCQYGENIDALNESERTFFITQVAETEVNGGGFSQFFFNSGGNFASEIVNAFTTIGAIKTAAICQQALIVIGSDMPIDHNERQEWLLNYENEETEAKLSQCDDAFYRYEENLNALNYDYVMKHEADFF